jgi:hypothetical protein
MLSEPTGGQGVNHKIAHYRSGQDNGEWPNCNPNQIADTECREKYAAVKVQKSNSSFAADEPWFPVFFGPARRFYAVRRCGIVSFRDAA